MPPAALVGADPDRLAAKLEPLFGHELAVQPPIIMKQLKAMGAYDATPRLAALAGIPTLVVSAEHDPIAPPKLGRALADGIPGSHHVELAGASHGVPIHDAPRVNQLIVEHLRKAEATPRGSAPG
jgi:pimeloyl-ACP methyl ester carboxylesterase